MPETSIIVRTFNEEKHLNRLFDAFANQSYDNFEVIVVDSGSLDASRDIAAKRADHLVRISSHDFTFGYSLNKGIEKADGRFIVIVSAHTIPVDDTWLDNLIAPLCDAKTAMTYGRQLAMECSKFSEAEDYRRIFGDEQRAENLNKLAANNANSAICRNLWESYPFDEELLGLEDIDWARYWMKQGLKVVYQPKAALYHIHEETWRQIRHRYYREAVAYRRMKIKRRRNIPREILREMGRTIGDFHKAFIVDGNPVAKRLSLGQRLREIVYFRLNMNYGTFKGLLEAHPMETMEARERALFDRTMAAAVISGPNNASLEEIEIPEVKPGDVLIRVAYTAVCATDLEIFRGTLGFYKNGTGKYPIIPGHEFSGRIVSVGQNVNGLKEDDPVVVECIQNCGVCPQCQAGNFIGCEDRAELGVLSRNGAYAGYVTVPARFVHKLPDGMGLRRAALCEPLAVVIKGYRRLALKGRRRCLVIGAGPLGHMFAKVLDHYRHEVTVFDRNPKRRALFDGTGIESSDTLDDLAKFNTIIEITGDPQVLDMVLRTSPANALILLLGLPYGETPFSFETIAAYDKTVSGSVGSTREDFIAAIKLLDKLDLDAYFQCPMRLRDFRAAWDKSKSGEVLKVILDIGQ